MSEQGGHGFNQQDLGCDLIIAFRISLSLTVLKKSELGRSEEKRKGKDTVLEKESLILGIFSEKVTKQLARHIIGSGEGSTV